MDILNLISPSSWPDRSYLWFYILIGIITYVLYTKISNYFYTRSIYSSSRVTRLENLRKAAWEKHQLQIDPNVNPEEENLKRDEKPIQKYDTDYDNSKNDRKKFKKIFGMDNLSGRAPCASGG